MEFLESNKHLLVHFDDLGNARRRRNESKVFRLRPEVGFADKMFNPRFFIPDDKVDLTAELHNVAEACHRATRPSHRKRNNRRSDQKSPHITILCRKMVIPFKQGQEIS